MVRQKKFARYLSILFSLFTTLGGLFLFYAFFAGIDDILSGRELLTSGIIVIVLFIISISASKNLSEKTLFLTFIISVLASTAVNFEFSEVMKLPVQLPAENLITVIDKDNNASLSMTWAYRFRPRTQRGDPFITNPDRDISFSQLIRSGNWKEISDGDESILLTREIGASIGVVQKLRFHLNVLCLRVSDGNIYVKISGNDEIIMITPEMTANQPYRVILKNGLLPETIGNILQVILWSGPFLVLLGAGTKIYEWVLLCSDKQQRTLIYLGGFLIPCSIMILLCIFLEITPFGEKSFLINDMWGEYADYMAYFRTIISGENDLFYSFSKSLGDDLLSLLAFYVINPLNWLVCLFKPEQLPLAITVLVILRYGFCGLSASIYFVKRRNCGFSALIFSTCYALMSFNIVNAENTNLRESAMVLPLVIMGLEQLIDGRSEKTYIWTLASAIFLNFYSGYQICIFAVIYFLFYFISKNSSSSFGKTVIRFIFCSFLAAGISAALLIPVIIQLRNGPKTFDPSIFGFSINTPWDAFFGKLLTSSYNIKQISEGYPNLYVGLICVFLIPLFFMNKNISSRHKFANGALLSFSILILQINPLNLVLHGFSAPLWWPYRYSFIICFFMVIITQESYSNRLSVQKREFGIVILLFAALLIILRNSAYDWMNAENLKLNAALFAGIVLILTVPVICADISNSSTLLAIMTVLDLFLNGNHVLSINTAYERSNTVQDYVSFYSDNKSIIDRIKTMDDSFYRIEKSYSRTPNDPMLLDYNGITHYSSTLSSNVMKFLSNTGFRRYPPYRILYWEGSDITMDSLLGIKYLVSSGHITKPYTPVDETGIYTIYENPYTLPIMFTASKNLLEVNISGKNGFEIQNQIFRALTGNKEDIFHSADIIEFISNGLIPEKMINDICYVPEKERTGSLFWNITAANNNPLYAFFPSENIHQVKTSLNGNPFGIYFDEYSYHILRLGSFDRGQAVFFEMTPMEDKICLNDALFYHEDTALLEQAVSVLKKDKTELRKATSSHLEGNFNASSDKMLFFTIPFNNGWTIRIDGNKVPIYKVFDIFMAVPVTEGTHTVDMRYVPIGLIPGIIISIISVAAVLFINKKHPNVKH